MKESLKINPNEPSAARYFIDLALGEFFIDEDETGREVFFRIIVSQKDDRVFNFYCETFVKSVIFGYIGKQKRKIFDKTIVLPFGDMVILDKEPPWSKTKRSLFFMYYGRFDHVDDYLLYDDENDLEKAFLESKDL